MIAASAPLHTLETLRHDTAWATTVEDKDPSVLWILRTETLAATIMRQLLDAPSRWSVRCLDHRAVELFYRKLADKALPPSLPGWHTPISCWNVPYIYGSVKRKCFTDSNASCGLRKRCCVAHHSCFRNIVSFYRMPSRRACKYLGRALSLYLKSTWHSASFGSMKTATEECEAAFTHLTCRETCVLCGTSIENIAVNISDAGQAYEVLSVTAILDALNYL